MNNMKKIIIFLGATVFALMAYSQAEKRTNVVTISHPNVNFSIPLPAYSLVYVESTNTLYRISGYYDTSESVNDAISDGNAIPFMDDPMTTRGDIIYRNAANETARLGVGTNGQVVTTNGTDLLWGSAGDTSYFDLTGTVLSTKDAITLMTAPQVQVEDTLKVGSATTSGVVELTATDGDKGELKITTDDYLILDGFARVNLGDNPIYSGTSTASGTTSVALGSNNNVTGNNSTALGSGNAVSGDNAMALGIDNKIYATRGVALGGAHTIRGESALAAGTHNYVNSDADRSAAFGSFGATSIINQLSIAAGRFAAYGDAQASIIPSRNSTEFSDDAYKTINSTTDDAHWAIAA